jgi:general secretion pathway protein A
MYTNFFGFKERPFQLVPNPEYLYLSRSHEEALAHLNYAISHGDGFVEITGEVGTGKTTLCRAFLEDLNKNTEVAYIFNPRLNSLELLRAINDEFAVPSQAANAKDLIDALNAFLLEKKSRKKNAILLIDEAQSLSKEVLEQLRLLSNLETNKSKLLQIILVGQPELREKLDAFELRQLRQRITLRWHLTSLSFKETRAYIRHRVNIASKKTEDKFTHRAYPLIYRYSGGIPRLINIACDRAFLTAYGLNRLKVTGSIARNAIKELRARGEDTHRFFTKGRVLFGLIAMLCLALPWVFQFKVPTFFKTGKTAVEKTVNTTLNRESSVKPGPVTKIPGKFADFLGNLTNHSSRLIAVKTIISLWNKVPIINRYLDNIDNDGDFFRLAATQNNFHILPVNDNLDLIIKLNLPAILEFLPPGAFSPRYLTLTKITGREIILKGGKKNETLSLEPEEIESHWSGAAYILWKNFFNCKGVIPIDAPRESVLSLKMLLRDIGFKEIRLDNLYDNTTQEAVEKLQEKHGIKVDGIVGAKTKIVIYNEKKELTIPHIRPFNDSDVDKSRGIKEN